MKFEVLLSCMHQKDADIIKRSNLQHVQTLVINQSDVLEDAMIQLDDKHRIINTKERGLSNSRNRAIDNSVGDICLLSDDDEIFNDDLEQRVIGAYKSYPKADIIIFKLVNLNKKLGKKPRKLRKYDLLRVSSHQISFKKDSVIGRVRFDTCLGAGTGNGGGEENKFLLDCYKEKLKIYFVPVIIGELSVGAPSTWFNGFDENYFYNLGASLRYILGFHIAVLYSIYTLMKKRKIFKKHMPIKRVRKALFKGLFENKLEEKKK